MPTLRCELVKCRGVLVERTDRLGRLHFDCPKCIRRRAGVCAFCPNPVEGRLGIAKYCRPCKRLAHRYDHERYRLKDLAAYNKSARERAAARRLAARQGKPALTQREVGILRGLARAASLTPERRTEIAKNAGRTRWAKHRQREMLRRMQASGTSTTTTTTPPIGAHRA